jgi:hypothetical protein
MMIGLAYIARDYDPSMILGEGGRELGAAEAARSGDIGSLPLGVLSQVEPSLISLAITCARRSHRVRWSAEIVATAALSQVAWHYLNCFSTPIDFHSISRPQKLPRECAASNVLSQSALRSVGKTRAGRPADGLLTLPRRFLQSSRPCGVLRDPRRQ